MEAKFNIALVGIVGRELKIKGENMDKTNKHKYLYAAYSCHLLDECVIEMELNKYIEANNTDIFEIDDLHAVVDTIFENHILNLESDHNIKNKNEVMRKL